VCNNFLFTYEPMAHQQRFHEDPAKYKMWGGGFGSAKTSTCGAEFVMLALKTPRGVGLVGASTYPQLERTSKKQVLDMIPEEFIDSYNKKDNILTLTNGYEIMFRSFDDEQKLKSLNLCHAWIEEANGVDYSIFVQLQTRLRHHATKEHKILLTTNPAMNWVRTEILLKSKTIYGAKERYNRASEDKNPNISTHIARTDQNTYLPPDYIDAIKVGKPDYWIKILLSNSNSLNLGEALAV
jgi:phage terminase large subunit